MELEEKLEQLKQWVADSSRIVFFGGAGVSTESGIPDFRSVDGLYHQKYQYPPETILSHTFYMRRPKEFFAFYWDKMIYPAAEPNTTHKVLARLEQEGKLTAVVTQNIDGLHQLAGSKRVLELHGSVLRNYCSRCARFYSLEELRQAAVSSETAEGEQNAASAGEENLTVPGIPRCACGGIIKPDVVLYEEVLDEQIMSEAIDAIAEADMLIVGGTSLSVYPAAGLIRYYQGDKLVLINKTATTYDDRADLVLHAGLGEVFGSL